MVSSGFDAAFASHLCLQYSILRVDGTPYFLSSSFFTNLSSASATPAATALVIASIVIGDCMSAAVNVLQACTKRISTPHSWFLVHPLSSQRAHSFDEDFPRRKEEWERIMRTMHDQICKILARRTKRSIEEIDRMIKEGDRFLRVLSAQEAL